MSTKSTIEYVEDEFHLYTDFLNPGLWLEIEVARFSATSGGTLDLQLPVSVVRAIINNSERLNRVLENIESQKEEE